MYPQLAGDCRHDRDQIAAGNSFDEALDSYPYLERADILEALRYSAWLAEEREVGLASA